MFDPPPCFQSVAKQGGSNTARGQIPKISALRAKSVAKQGGGKHFDLPWCTTDFKKLRFKKFSNFPGFSRSPGGARLGLVWCTEMEFGDVLWCFGKLGVRSFWKCYLVRNHFWKCYLVRDDQISENFKFFENLEEIFVFKRFGTRLPGALDTRKWFLTARIDALRKTMQGILKKLSQKNVSWKNYQNRDFFTLKISRIASFFLFFCEPSSSFRNYFL